MIRVGNIRMGVDPLGGAGVHYWAAIAERHKLNLTVVNNEVDPTFRFMTVDWDGKIRMDPSSNYAMRGLIDLKDRFDIAYACDTDHDRHGIVTRSAGLLPSNDYLAVAIHYLFQNRPHWRPEAGVGKTVVSSRMIDRVASKLDRRCVEVPVGFKWFVDGLLDGSLASWRGKRRCVVSPEGRHGVDHGQGWHRPCAVVGGNDGSCGARSWRALPQTYRRIRRADLRAHRCTATPAQKKLLSQLTPRQVVSKELAGEVIDSILTEAPGNGAGIGGLKVMAENGGLRHDRLVPRTSIISTPRVIAEPSTCIGFSRKHSSLSPPHLRQPPVRTTWPFSN
jgi:phosphoglucomutase